MKPPKVVFACTSCGSQSPKWLGRCPDCGAWNSFVEETTVASDSRASITTAGGGRPRRYEDVQADVAARIGSGISEFDRVLGGGIVPGAVVLVAGEPGIGKSTLLLDVAARGAGGGEPGERRVLYVQFVPMTSTPR